MINPFTIFFDWLDNLPPKDDDEELQLEEEMIINGVYD